MTNNTDKTIPYHPSAADLENLRQLWRRTHPPGYSQNDVKEANVGAKVNTQDSNPNQPMQKSEKNNP